MAFELVTFDQIKSVLKLDRSTLQEYPPLVVLKPSVEVAISDFLGRELESVERTESVYLSQTKMVSLKGLPVASVSAVTATDAYGNQETLTFQEDFRITPFGIRLFGTYRDIDLEVTYTGGYADDAVPEPISRAALMQTVYEYQKSPNLGAELVNTEGGSITYPELGLLKHVQNLLQPYVHPLRTGIL